MTRLNTAQLHLLKMLDREISDSDLSEIKQMLARYFAEKLTKLADKAWEDHNVNEGFLTHLHERVGSKQP